MATIILNNFNIGNEKNSQTDEEIPLYKLGLTQHIGQCLNLIPPKQLCRLLRDGLIIHFEELMHTCPKFKEIVTELGILMSRLDAEEDNRSH